MTDEKCMERCLIFSSFSLKNMTACDRYCRILMESSGPNDSQKSTTTIDNRIDNNHDDNSCDSTDIPTTPSIPPPKTRSHSIPNFYYSK